MKILTSTLCTKQWQVEIFCSIISITVLRIVNYSIPIQVVGVDYIVWYNSIKQNKIKGAS